MQREEKRREEKKGWCVCVCVCVYVCQKMGRSREGERMDRRGMERNGGSKRKEGIAWREAGGGL